MRAFLLFLPLALVSAGAYAQSPGNCMVSYPISFPMGNLHDYSSNTSFRGISFEFNKKTSPYTTAGLEVGWNVFYQHVDKKVYQEGTASITGVQYRYTNAVPIIAGVKYYKKTGSKAMRPFVGVGLGTIYVNRTTDFGLYEIVSDSWQFALRPEVGIDFKVASAQAFWLGAKYMWGFNTSNLDGQQWLSINIGFRSGL